MTALERNGILAGGTWVLDHTKIIDFFPAQDALANVLAETLSNGGGPYNVLIGDCPNHSPNACTLSRNSATGQL